MANWWLPIGIITKCSTVFRYSTASAVWHQQNEWHPVAFVFRIQGALVEEHLTNPKGLRKQNHKPPKTLPCRRCLGSRVKESLKKEGKESMEYYLYV